MTKLLSNTWKILIHSAALVFLFNVQSFVIGQESEKNLESSELTESIKVEDDETQETTKFPDWFVADVQYVSETKMGFVQTPESYMTRDEAKTALARESRRIAKSIVEKQLGISDAESLGLDGERIIHDFLVEDRLEIVEDLECKREAEAIGDDLTFYKGFAQIEFGDAFDAYVQQRVAECRTQKRLIKSGLIGGSLLGLLAVAFGYFKMENATRGFYSRRLQTVSFLVAAAVIFMAYLISQQVV